MCMPGFELFDDDERRQINDVMETGILFRYGFDAARNNQWKAREFEVTLANKLGVKYAHLCASGTAALSTALFACGIGLGDEVIVPPFTFIATIEAIILAGATPVFAEIDETLCLCPDSLVTTITSRTKAILVVHMCGAMARIDNLAAFCQSNGLILLEDACQAIGGTFNGQALGSFGQAGCFSFDFVKTITCGEGGAVITNCHDTYVAADSFTDHGHDHIGNDRGAENHLSIGTNLRTNELNAAIGVAQLKKLDRILEIQKNNKAIIESAIEPVKGIEFRKIPDKEGDSSTFLSIFMPDREKASEAICELNKSGIDGCFYWFDNNWHYIKQWDHIKSLKSHVELPLKSLNNLPNYSKLILPKSDFIIGKTISIQIKLGWSTKEVEARARDIALTLKKIA